MYSVLSRRGLPVFAAFFLWSFGTGANNLARPLFAASFGVPLLLVTLITSSNSASHLVSGPVTGYLMDRWGRKPFLILGLGIRGGSALAEFFATNYLQYLVLEFLGGLGVAIWTTGSSVLLADLTVGENRGRAVALRSMSTRVGFIVGPFVGAVIATAFELRAIFLFNALTKVAILAIVSFLIAESRPQTERDHHRGRSSGEDQLPFSIFFTRSFLIISLVTFSISMMTQGVFASLFPVYLKGTEGFSTAEIGNLMTLAGLASLAITFPNGLVVDRYGRKSTLVPGLLIFALAAGLLTLQSGYGGVALMVIVYGLGEGMCLGASQVYAMDLAPDDRRGSFLGMWSVLSQSGSLVAPLLVGFAAERIGFGPTFVGVAATLGLMASVMGLLGPDTRSRAARRAAASQAAGSVLR